MRGNTIDVLGNASRRLGTLLQRSLREFFEDDCPQRAAAISYYTLFSLFPLAILLVAVFGLIVDDEAARRRVIELVLDNVPLREDRGRADLQELLRSVTSAGTGFGIVGVAGLLFAASAVMGAVRQALNAAWDVATRRPFLQGKLIDLLLVLSVGAVVAISTAMTFGIRLAAALSEEAVGVGDTAGELVAAGRLVPVILTFGVCALLFCVMPVPHRRLRDTWPGIALVTLGFEVAKIGFAVYLEHFADYGAVYSSLGGIVAFLVFIFVAANIFLFGAEAASEWPAVRDEPAGRSGDGPPGRRTLQALQALQALRGRFVRPREARAADAGRRAGAGSACRRAPEQLPDLP